MIAVKVVQHRGNQHPVSVTVSMENVPHVGENVLVLSSTWMPIVDGRVESVTHEFKCSEGGGTSFSIITVTLTGWTNGFGKD